MIIILFLLFFIIYFFLFFFAIVKIFGPSNYSVLPFGKVIFFFFFFCKLLFSTQVDDGHSKGLNSVVCKHLDHQIIQNYLLVKSGTFANSL